MFPLTLKQLALWWLLAAGKPRWSGLPKLVGAHLKIDLTLRLSGRWWALFHALDGRSLLGKLHLRYSVSAPAPHGASSLRRPHDSMALFMTPSGGSLLGT